MELAHLSRMSITGFWVSSKCRTQLGRDSQRHDMPTICIASRSFQLPNIFQVGNLVPFLCGFAHTLGVHRMGNAVSLRDKPAKPGQRVIEIPTLKFTVKPQCQALQSGPCTLLDLQCVSQFGIKIVRISETERGRTISSKDYPDARASLKAGSLLACCTSVRVDSGFLNQIYSDHGCHNVPRL
jgi:hypothetical protein